jgi:hypothetical protein
VLLEVLVLLLVVVVAVRGRRGGLPTLCPSSPSPDLSPARRRWRPLCSRIWRATTGRRDLLEVERAPRGPARQ